MFNSLRQISFEGGFMPLGYCYLWQPGVIWLRVLSEALIVAACFSIPFAWLYFAHKRRDLEFNWMLVGFAIFFVVSGVSHLMDIWTIWNPSFWVAGTVKAITALALVPTAIILAKLVPTGLRLPNATALRRSNEELESRVAERTAQLEATNRSLLQEVRERQRAEESVRSGQQLLQAVINNSTTLVYVKDAAGHYLLINQRYEELFDVTLESMLGKTDYEVFPKENADAFRAVDLRVLEATGPQQMEEVVPLKDGLHTYVSVKCPLHDELGKPYAVCGISTDITERQQSEQRQRQQLGQLELLNRITHAVGERQDLPSIFQVVIRSLEEYLPIDFGCFCHYDSSAESLTIVQAGNRVRSRPTDPLFVEHTRLSIDNWLSRCVRGELVYEPDTSAIESRIAQQFGRGGMGSMILAPLSVDNGVFGLLMVARRNTHAFSAGECEFLRQLCEHVSLAAHQAKVHAALQLAYDDIRNAQRTIMQQERLRALGQIASGIAHDINNAITPITLYTEFLLEREPNLSERGRDQISIIQRAIDDVAQTVSRMRDFYRQREPEHALELIDLNRIVKEVIDLTRARWKDLPQRKGQVIDLQTDLSADLPGIAGAESEIRGAITNLIFNALDAMPEGGVLTLRTLATQPGEQSFRFACVEVRDSGVGMDEETRRRCLEPFFTTKGERGTGLGLAMVFGMAQRHSAELQIDSEPNRGTTMRLVFPAAAPVASSAVVQSKSPKSQLRILVVDDDPMLMRSLVDTLEMDGHLVTAAEGGQAGIDVFTAARTRGEAFTMVITDLGMPHVDGRKVAAAVRANSPTTPIILLTGWGQQPPTENDVPIQVDRVLSKPPKLHELRTALAELSG